MPTPRYLWRQLSQKQREELLAWRKQRGYPWHSPPHRPNFRHRRFLISAACFEHHYYIGHSPERMDQFSRDLLAVFAARAGETFAWCVLPNHNTRWSKRLTYNLCCTSWVCCTAAPRTLGTAKSRHAAEKFSSARSNARCVQIGIIGRR
jgi:hypothetical protein